MMKRFTVFVLGFIFLFCTFALVVEQATAGPAPTDPVKAKVAKRQKTGTVVNLTDALIKIEFAKKGKKDSMEFGLTEPAKVSVGEKVTVYYTEKDGKKEAFKVTVKKTSAKKSTKKKTISKN
jgi:ribosomal protein S1